MSARAALLGAPVMLVLFLLFPRIGPLWGLPQDAGAKTGLSGTMRMGAVAELANDDTVALRIRFEGTPPPPQTLYFRGPVLGAFDGFEWRRMEPSVALAEANAGELQLLGAPVAYEMTLEPSRLPVLPLLQATPRQTGDAPSLPGWRVFSRAELEWSTDRPITERLRFNARAWPAFRYGPTEPRWGLREYLQLPAGFNPRMLQWAAQLRRDPRYANAGASQLAQLLQQQIRAGGFVYTLTPGTYGRDAIDEFWFDRKQGFCEHYAAAFVVAMRALGVPARIVTGYQGTDRQPIDGYWIVRQSHAHAWAEYWERGRGWVHADPTAAVSPERIVRSQSLPPNPGLMAQAIRNVSPELLAQLRSTWELVNNRWNQWVLGYSSRQQFQLLEQLGVRAPKWTDLGLMLASLVSGAALVGAGWAWWDRRRQDPWQRLLGRVRRRLQRLGVAAEPHAPPRTMALAVRARFGAAGEPVSRQLQTLDRLRYGPDAATRPQPWWWRGFVRDAAALAQHAAVQKRSP